VYVGKNFATVHFCCTCLKLSHWYWKLTQINFKWHMVLHVARFFSSCSGLCFLLNITIDSYWSSLCGFATIPICIVSGRGKWWKRAWLWRLKLTLFIQTPGDSGLVHSVLRVFFIYNGASIIWCLGHPNSHCWLKMQVSECYGMLSVKLYAFFLNIMFAIVSGLNDTRSAVQSAGRLWLTGHVAKLRQLWYFRSVLCWL